MQIEAATVADCHAIAQVHVESSQHAYRGILADQYLASLCVSEREALWRRVVERQSTRLLVARIAGEVAGFIAFGASCDEGPSVSCAEIFALYLKPASWSVGAGRELWLAALRRIVAEGYRSVGLWVIAANARAINFYERAGFIMEPGSGKPLQLGGVMVEEVRYVLSRVG